MRSVFMTFILVSEEKLSVCHVGDSCLRRNDVCMVFLCRAVDSCLRRNDVSVDRYSIESIKSKNTSFPTSIGNPL